MNKQWKITFDFKVNAHSSAYQNILDFGPPPSGRDPAFWINPNKKLDPVFKIDGAYKYINVPVTIVEGQYYSVEISQTLVYNQVFVFKSVIDIIQSLIIFKYVLQVKLDNRVYYTGVNTAPVVRQNVEVMASNNVHSALNGVIRNLEIKPFPSFSAFYLRKYHFYAAIV